MDILDVPPTSVDNPSVIENIGVHSLQEAQTRLDAISQQLRMLSRDVQEPNLSKKERAAIHEQCFLLGQERTTLRNQLVFLRQVEHEQFLSRKQQSKQVGKEDHQRSLFLPPSTFEDAHTRYNTTLAEAARLQNIVADVRLPSDERMRAYRHIPVILAEQDRLRPYVTAFNAAQQQIKASQRAQRDAEHDGDDQVAQAAAMVLGTDVMTALQLGTLNDARSIAHALYQLTRFLERKGRVTYSDEEQELLRSVRDTLVRISTPPTPQRFPWKLLGSKVYAPGVGRLTRYADTQQRRRSEHTYDAQRLETLYALQPTAIYVGSDEFEGYIVFVFGHHELAILECPHIGNALYVLRGSWQILARKSKTELMHDRTGAVTRIPHQGDWLQKVQALLRKGNGAQKREHTPPSSADYESEGA